MLPNPYPNPLPTVRVARPRTRPRPISPSDNPSTTGLPVNSSGTYITPPSTAAAGNQGQFGSMLPATAVGIPNLTSSSPNPSQFLQPVQVRPNLNTANSFNGWTAQQASVQSQSQARAFQQQGLQQYQNSERGTAPTGSPSTTSLAGANSFFNPATGVPNATEMLSRIANGEMQNLTPAQAEAIDNLLGISSAPVTTTAAGSNQQIANTDFTNTGFYQQYQAQGTSFENQQRWDPERKKYVKIGQLINEGRLDVRDRNARLRRPRGGRARQQQVAETRATGPTQTTGGFVGSFGVVNFNTGSG
jgi:hypothetical protein